MLRVTWDHILIQKAEKKWDWIIAKVEDDNLTRGKVILASKLAQIEWVQPWVLVHFPAHTPQRIDHDWKAELYVIKLEDVLLISVADQPKWTFVPETLEPNKKKKWQK